MRSFQVSAPASSVPPKSNRIAAGECPFRASCAARASGLTSAHFLTGTPPDPPSQLHVGVERSEEHTSELQSLAYLVCRLLLEKKKKHHTDQVACSRVTLNTGHLCQPAV